MIWVVLVLGLLLAGFGAVSGTALVTASRLELTRAVSRKLRGAPGSLAWLSEIETDLAVASATTSLGVVMLGAAVPAI
ncbi:MAG: hypothetical protein ACREMO_04095, partial [Gemmatimonadales bacterium]